MTVGTITAIVVTRNRRQDLRRCLDALARQQPPVEIIVVDNASTDGTEAMLRRDFPDVTVLRAADNFGTSVTRNAAATIARGRYLWFLDDDAEVRAVNLGARLITLLHTDPDLAAIGGEAVLDAGGEIIGVKRLNMLVNGMVRGEFLTELGTDQLAAADVLATCCLFIRRDAFESVAGFDPLFRFYREDMDLSARLRQAGWKLAVPGRLPVVHHFSPSERGARLLTPQIHRNVYLFRHRRARDLLLLPLHDLGYLLSPRSLQRALHAGRNAALGAAAMVVQDPTRPTRAGAWLLAVRRGGALALAMLAGYVLCLPRLPAALRRRGTTAGGLHATDLSPYTRRDPHSTDPS